MLMQVEGKRIGLRPDEPTRQVIARFTRDWFSQRQTDLRAGRAIDGRAITVAYGLWTLEMAEVGDPVTDAMADYLLKVQLPDGAWEPEAHRPPAEESKAFVTALALRGLRRVATSRRALNAADRAFEWLSMNAASAIESQSVDEQAGHLLSYAWRSDRFPGETKAFRQERIKEWSERLVKLQRGNGGWSQRSGMESDPYATGLALWSLAESGFDAQSEPYQRGTVYLRSRQAADGSWHTRSRCEPFQPYFDNGDPYGRDQFLSLMATAWAAAALARTENAADDD
jgi:N-acyl-D-amino-acid deacylase